MEASTDPCFTLSPISVPSLFPNGVFIYIVDDWNWLQVKDGTFKSIADSKLKVLYEKEILTSGEDFNDYWNGLGVFVLKNEDDKKQEEK